MEIVRRLTKTAHFNYVLYVLGAALLVYALTLPMISDPIINFLFGGIVPGTSMILSPITVLWIAGSLLALGLLIIVSVSVAKARRRRVFERRIQSLVAEAAPSSDLAPVVHIKTNPKADVNAEIGPISALLVLSEHIQAKLALRRMARQSALGIKANRQSGRGRLIRGRISTLAIDYKIMPRVKIALTWLTARARRAMRWSGWALMVAAKSVIQAETWLVEHAIDGVVVAARITALSSRRLWQWAGPYLRRFDSWLELRYRALSRRLDSRLSGSEPLQVMRDTSHSSVKSVQRRIRS